MKKIYLLLIVIVLLFTGCDNKEENVKSEYLAMKSDLLKINDFSYDDEMNCDISVNIDRVNEEKVSYKMIINNVKENMHDVKAILIHNYYTEDVFPSVGLFDDTVDLNKNSNDNIILKGNIETDKDIDNLDLILKLYVKYLDDNGNEKDIYYKTTK